MHNPLLTPQLPKLPDGATFSEAISEAEVSTWTTGPVVLLKSLPFGPWDFKRSSSAASKQDVAAYRFAGNFMPGYIHRSAGVSDDTFYRGADAVQTLQNSMAIVRWVGRIATGPWESPPSFPQGFFRDDAVGHGQVIEGERARAGAEVLAWAKGVSLRQITLDTERTKSGWRPGILGARTSFDAPAADSRVPPVPFTPGQTSQTAQEGVRARARLNDTQDCSYYCDYDPNIGNTNDSDPGIVIIVHPSDTSGSHGGGAGGGLGTGGTGGTTSQSDDGGTDALVLPRAPQEKR
jgi:hypothetical protein